MPITASEMQIGRFTPSPYEHVAAATSSVGPVAPVIAPEAVKPAATDVDHSKDTILGDVPPAPTDEASNRVVIEVRDLEGNVIKTIPPAKALDIMSGAEL